MTDRTTTRCRDLIGDATHFTTEIARDLTSAISVLAGSAHTGYPTTNSDGPVSGGGTPDPTGNTGSLQRTGPHPDLAQLVTDLTTAVDHLQQAAATVHRHTPSRDAQPDDGDPGCASCLRAGHYSPRFRGDLCNWCYKHRDLNQPGAKAAMPALWLVQQHCRGKDLTTGDLRKAGVPL